MHEGKKGRIDFAMGDFESAKQIIARIFPILKECFQKYIPVKMQFLVKKSKLLDSIT